MTHATLTNLSRHALQSAALLLAFAPLCFGSEQVAPAGVSHTLGEMVVTATRVPPLMGHLVVTAPRIVAYVAVTDLGTMTVNAPRETVLASTGTFLATR